MEELWGASRNRGYARYAGEGRHELIVWNQMTTEDLADWRMIFINFLSYLSEQGKTKHFFVFFFYEMIDIGGCRLGM